MFLKVQDLGDSWWFTVIQDGPGQSFERSLISVFFWSSVYLPLSCVCVEAWDASAPLTQKRLRRLSRLSTFWIVLVRGWCYWVRTGPELCMYSSASRMQQGCSLPHSKLAAPAGRSAAQARIYKGWEKCLWMFWWMLPFVSFHRSGKHFTEWAKAQCAPMAQGRKSEDPWRFARHQFVGQLGDDTVSTWCSDKGTATVSPSQRFIPDSVARGPSAIHFHPYSSACLAPDSIWNPSIEMSIFRTVGLIWIWDELSICLPLSCRVTWQQCAEKKLTQMLPCFCRTFLGWGQKRTKSCNTVCTCGIPQAPMMLQNGFASSSQLLLRSGNNSVFISLRQVWISLSLLAWDKQLSTSTYTYTHVYTFLVPRSTQSLQPVALATNHGPKEE